MNDVADSTDELSACAEDRIEHNLAIEDDSSKMADVAEHKSSWADVNKDLADIMRAGREELEALSLEVSSCPVSILKRQTPSR